MNVQKPTHELSVEEVLRSTANLYVNHFFRFLMPTLVAALTTGAMSTLISSYMGTKILFDLSSTEGLNQVLSYITTLLAIALIYSVISLIISTMVSGICIKYASDLIGKGTATLQEAFNSTIHRLLPLMAVSIIVGLLVGLGLIALVVPGIILAIMYSLVAPVMMIEDVGISGSLHRSSRLVSRRWLKTFVFFFIIGMIVLFVSFAGTLFGSPFGEFSWIASSIITAIVGPILPISMTVYYYSMLAREEQVKASLPPPPF
jgi:hypothetical protein